MLDAGVYNRGHSEPTRLLPWVHVKAWGGALNAEFLLVSGILRDWSLITGRGDYKTGGGGGSEVLPLRKRGSGKVLAMLNGGHKKF